MNEPYFVYRNGPTNRCSVGDYELHCGDCFQIKDGQTWRDVRIELSHDWYLIGVSPAAAGSWHGTDARRYKS